MQADRLFRLAHEALAINAYYEVGTGWFARVTMRRGDESWSEAEQVEYDQLTTPELVDALEAHLRSRLGL